MADVTTTVRLPPELHERLDLASLVLKASRVEIIRTALAAFLDRVAATEEYQAELARRVAPAAKPTQP